MKNAPKNDGKTFTRFLIFKFAKNRFQVKVWLLPDPKGHHQLVPVTRYGGTENLFMRNLWEIFEIFLRNLLFRNPFVRRYGGKSCYDKFLRNMDFRNLFVRRYGRRENLFMSNILEIYEKSFLWGDMVGQKISFWEIYTLEIFLRGDMAGEKIFLWSGVWERTKGDEWNDTTGERIASHSPLFFKTIFFQQINWDLSSVPAPSLLFGTKSQI